MQAKKKRKPYNQRSDRQKIRSNWRKIKTLMHRKQWSSAIVRAATATEIAANLVVRKELIDGYGLKRKFVDHLLRWSNGIHGKFENLIIPVTEGEPYHEDFRRLKERCRRINRERNSVVHSGEFKSREIAREVVTEAREIIQGLAAPYHEGFDLEFVNRRKVSTAQSRKRQN